jgi:hypothetical protein
VSQELNRIEHCPNEHDAGEQGVKLASLSEPMPRLALDGDAANDGDKFRGAAAVDQALEQLELAEDGRQVVHVVPGRRLELSALCEKQLSNKGHRANCSDPSTRSRTVSQSGRHGRTPLRHWGA